MRFKPYRTLADQATAPTVIGKPPKQVRNLHNGVIHQLPPVSQGHRQEIQTWTGLPKPKINTCRAPIGKGKTAYHKRINRALKTRW